MESNKKKLELLLNQKKNIPSTSLLNNEILSATLKKMK